MKKIVDKLHIVENTALTMDQENSDVTSVRTERSITDTSSVSTDTMESEGGETVRSERKENLHSILLAIRGHVAHKLRIQGTIGQYKLYAELCYPYIVGKQKWKLNHMHISLTTLTTVADEAIVALILENNIEEWIMLAKGESIQNDNRKTLYTHGGTDSKGTKKGWSLKGRKRYNQLHREVKEIRNHDNSESVDEQLKSIWNKKNSRNSTTQPLNGEDEGAREELEEEFEPAFDFDE